MNAITIRRGDTLNALASKYGVSVKSLVDANKLASADKILAGSNLVIPDKFEAKPTTSGASNGDGFETSKTTSVTNNTSSNVSGRYPVFNQGDPQWKANSMGSGGGSKNHIGAIGCAMTSVTMALDGITGSKMSPAQMNEFMKKNGGYTSGGSIQNWELMGKAVTPPVGVKRQSEGSFTPAKIDAELAAGRPVLVHVDYKQGSGANRKLGHDGQGDHWILITGKSADGKYLANDPAGGKKIELKSEGGKLHASSGGKDYISTGGAVTFSRGPTGGAQTPQPVTPSTVSTTTSTTNNGFKSIDPAKFREGGTSSLAAIVIGTSEGNRTAKGGFNKSFNGHTDPANGAHNIGSFSAQQKYATLSGGDPRKADELVLKDLAAQTPAYEAAAKQAGLDPKNSLLMATYYDLVVQSPATAQAFLKELPSLAKKGVTPQNIVDARVHAFDNNGKSGGWHTAGNHHKVAPDALRRTTALVTALKAQGLG
jgi:hypothetical protein